MFVRHEAYDEYDNLLPSDGQNFPGKEKNAKSNSKPNKDMYNDPAIVESSDDDFDSSNENEDEYSQAPKTHKFVIDLVARYTD